MQSWGIQMRDSLPVNSGGRSWLRLSESMLASRFGATAARLAVAGV